MGKKCRHIWRWWFKIKVTTLYDCWQVNFQMLTQMFVNSLAFYFRETVMIVTCVKQLQSWAPLIRTLLTRPWQMNSQFTHFLWSETSTAQLQQVTESDELESKRQSFRNGWFCLFQTEGERSFSIFQWFKNQMLTTMSQKWFSLLPLLLWNVNLILRIVHQFIYLVSAYLESRKNVTEGLCVHLRGKELTLVAP